ncbi:hypothetical protein BDB01DRAFT_482007 [Pilobolus umbonatus]|nr:hypothetical protein BDB01DRAFT_482007 [Pilobolus umbonatus]
MGEDAFAYLFLSKEQNWNTLNVLIHPNKTLNRTRSIWPQGKTRQPHLRLLITKYKHGLQWMKRFGDLSQEHMEIINGLVDNCATLSQPPIPPSQTMYSTYNEGSTGVLGQANSSSLSIIPSKGSFFESEDEDSTSVEALQSHWLLIHFEYVFLYYSRVGDGDVEVECTVIRADVAQHSGRRITPTHINSFSAIANFTRTSCLTASTDESYQPDAAISSNDGVLELNEL